jgi:hypothetical protein
MTLSEYFAENRYQPTYLIGDRVMGAFEGIKFVGSVGTDSVISEAEEPHVTVTLDLPLLYNGRVYNVLRVPTSSVTLRL